MTQKKIICPYCFRTYSTRAIHYEQGRTGCKDCLSRLSKGQEPLKYGKKPKRGKK